MKLNAMTIVLLLTACTDITAKQDSKPDGRYAVIFSNESQMRGQVPVVVRISRTDEPRAVEKPEYLMLTFGMWNQLFFQYASPVAITAKEGLLLKSPCCPIASSHLHLTSPIYISLKPTSLEGAQLFVSRRCHDAGCSVAHSCRA